MVKSGGFAFGALVAARSSIGARAATNNEPVDPGWGPGVLFGRLLAIVDEKIEQSRFTAMAKTLHGLDELPSPLYIYGFVLPYCYLQSERRAGPAEMEIANKLKEIEEASFTTQHQKSLLMFTALQKEFGSACLAAAINLNDKSKKHAANDELRKTSSMFAAQSDKLDDILGKFTSGAETAPSADAQPIKPE